jgi:hypothetical protein
MPFRPQRTWQSNVDDVEPQARRQLASLSPLLRDDPQICQPIHKELHGQRHQQ